MFKPCVRHEGSFLGRRYASVLLAVVGLLALAPRSWAQVNLGPVTVGAGLRTDFVDTEPDQRSHHQPVSTQ